MAATTDVTRYTNSGWYTIVWYTGAYPSGFEIAGTETYSITVSGTSGVTTVTTTQTGSVSNSPISETIAIPVTIGPQGYMADLTYSQITTSMASSDTASSPPSSSPPPSSSSTNQASPSASNATISTASPTSIATTTNYSSGIPSNSPTNPGHQVSNTSAPNQSFPGISKGEIAGIAIASSVAGAIIAALAVLLLIRRRRESQNGFHPGWRTPSDSNGDVNGSKSPTMAMKPLPLSNGAKDIDALLPSPLQDRDIESEFSRLGTAINNHARSYFGNGSSSKSLQTDSGIVKCLSSLLGTKSPLESNKLAAILSNPRSRTAGVRYLLAWAILDRSKTTTPREVTLLPPEIVELVQTFDTASDVSSSIQISSTVISNCTNILADRIRLLTKWRQISAAMLAPKYSDRSIPPSDPRHHNIRKLLDELDTVLAPFASVSNNSERVQNMAELIKRGARFAYTLFTQPTEWDFDWEQFRSRTTSELVVYPALVQTVGDDGIERRTPLRFGEAVQTSTIS